jgi:hypothetical protein
MVSFTPPPLYLRGKSQLYLLNRKWVGLRNDLDDIEKLGWINMAQD